MTLALTLFLMGMIINPCDITEFCPRYQTQLFQVVLAHLLVDLQAQYPEVTLMRVIKPLGGIPEAGLHCLSTYRPQHIKALKMIAHHVLPGPDNH